MSTAIHECLPGDSSNQCKQTTTQEPVRYGTRAGFAAWDLLGKRWTFLVIAVLLAGSQSFQELFKLVPGISESVLSDRLKELEREGVVRREVHKGRPIRVIYHLTAKGRALESVIKAIEDWSQFL